MAVSLIADPVGIYYDARQPSRLERLIATPCDAGTLARAERLIGELVRLGVTKYNCYASRLIPPRPPGPAARRLPK